MFIVLTAATCIFEAAFGALWLRALFLQDGDLCCGLSRLARVAQSPAIGVNGQGGGLGYHGGAELVVGRPVAIGEPGQGAEVVGVVGQGAVASTASPTKGVS